MLPEAQAHSLIARWQTKIYLGPVWIQVRSGSRALRTFTHRGCVYVVGRKGLRYSIYIKNRTNKRLETVVSVDGRDVISGRNTRGYTRRGYVLNSYRYVNITGFRTSRTSVAAFRFSSIRNSYASQMGGSWTRVGKIHVAIFREKRRIAYVPRPLIQHNRGRWHSRSLRRRPRSGTRSQPRRKAAKNKRRSFDSSGRSAGAAPRHGTRRRRWIRRPTPGLGTAFGGYRYAPARFTTFTRASSSPSHTLTIGYNNCAGFRSWRICTRWCPCYRRWSWRYRRRIRRLPRRSPRRSPYAQPPRRVR